MGGMPLHASKQSPTRPVVRQNHVTIHVAVTQLVRRYDGSGLTTRKDNDSNRGPQSNIAHHCAKSNINDSRRLDPTVQRLILSIKAEVQRRSQDSGTVGGGDDDGRGRELESMLAATGRRWQIGCEQGRKL